MSCSYADGLSPYENKGVLGVPEIFEEDKKVSEKCSILADWIKNSKHVVIHTGAGISTTAGIPDFRGPNGVWTLEKRGEKPNIDISFDAAIPTKTHMAIKHLVDRNLVHYIVSQNIDGLHLKSGVPRSRVAELHGNMFIGQCGYCDSQFVRSKPTETVGQKSLKERCRREFRGRVCRGTLHDTILDWEAGLPEKDLEMSEYHSSLADLNICFGTTLQIVPSGNLPLKCKKYGGRVVIVNLQPTKHDKKADLIINSYVDNVMERVMKKLELEIPDYSKSFDPTKHQIPESIIEWNIAKTNVIEMRKKFNHLNKNYKKRKMEEHKRNSGAGVKKKLKKIAEVENQIIKIDLTSDNSTSQDSIKEKSNCRKDPVDLTNAVSDDDLF